MSRVTPWLMIVILAAAGLEARAEVDSLATRVERAAADVARSRVTPPDRFEVLSSRFGGGEPIDSATVRLEPVQVDGPNSSGVFHIRFRMLVEDVPRGEVRASVRGRIHGPALKASRTLVRGKLIDAADLEVADADLTRLGTKPLREAEQVLGRVSVRTLGAGRVLTEDLLVAAPVVQRGQLVELRIERDHMQIRALGKTLRPGVAGDVVPAENIASGVRLEGVVQLDGSLLVLQHGGAARWRP